MIEKSIHFVFVYGTLKRGQGNHRWVASSRFVKEDSMAGWDLHDMGHFPCVVRSKPSAIVHGEVYQVDRLTMMSLDRLEGYPDHYDRIRKPTESNINAWIYYYTAPRGVKIESGVWTYGAE